MGRVEAFGHLDGDGKSLFARQAVAALNARRERLPREQLHGEKAEGRAGAAGKLMHPDFENAAHVEMGDPAGKVDFSVKPSEVRFVPGDVGAQGFEGDIFIEEKIAGLIHFAHAAAADKFRDAIALGQHFAVRKSSSADDGLIEEVPGVIVLLQEALDFGSKLRIVGTSL